MLKIDSVRCQLATHRFEWSFRVPEGAFLAVTGGSGVGKSTLLNVLLGFQPIECGSMQWAGNDLSGLKVYERPFGVLFQKDNLFEHLSVEKNLALGLHPGAKLNGEQREQLWLAAERFQIQSILAQKAMRLSGGQQQRVALARVFLQNKPVLLLDEPFSSLDPGLRQEGLEWVSEMQKQQGTTVVMVTHHLDEIEPAVDSILEGVSSDCWKQYPAR